MTRTHTLILAVMFGLAAVVGGVALTHTLDLGAASRHANDAVVVSRTRQLNQFERSLHRQLAKAPVVKKAVVKSPVAATPLATAPQAPVIAPASQPQAQRIVYVRPKPIIIHKHRAGGGEYEAGHDNESEGGGSDD